MILDLSVFKFRKGHFDMKKYYFIYKTTNNINNRFYIGAHGTNNLNDGYIGSGRNLKLAINKHGKDKFKFEILEYLDDYKSLMKREREIVNEEFLSNRIVYNSEVGGAGGKIWSNELKLKMSNSKKGHVPWNHGLTRETDERVNKLSIKSGLSLRGRFSGEKNPMFGVYVGSLMSKEDNEQRINKISRSNKGKTRTEEHKKNYSKYASKRFWIVNKFNNLKHCISLEDERLLSGEFKRGRIWL